MRSNVDRAKVNLWRLAVKPPLVVSSNDYFNTSVHRQLLDAREGPGAVLRVAGGAGGHHAVVHVLFGLGVAAVVQLAGGGQVGRSKGLEVFALHLGRRDLGGVDARKGAGQRAQALACRHARAHPLGVDGDLTHEFGQAEGFFGRG